MVHIPLRLLLIDLIKYLEIDEEYQSHSPPECVGGESSGEERCNAANWALGSLLVKRIIVTD